MFDRRPLDVAPDLLGWSLVVEGPDGTVEARITETEAYEHTDDPASHAHHPIEGIRRSPRNTSMFGPPGTLYVYRSYGIHWCANVVCWPEGEPGAVLVRAVEVTSGEGLVDRRRAGRRSPRERTGGPGRVCAALGIDGDHDGLDLCAHSSPVRLRPPEVPPAAGAIVRGPRIGITKGVDLPWRFGIADHPTLSRPFGPPSRR